jgi:hypothetical protein
MIVLGSIENLAVHLLGGQILRRAQNESRDHAWRNDKLFPVPAIWRTAQAIHRFAAP